MNEEVESFSELLDLCIKLTEPYVKIENMFQEEKNMEGALCSLNEHFKKMKFKINTVTCKSVEFSGKIDVLQQDKHTGTPVSIRLVSDNSNHSGIYLGRIPTAFSIDDKKSDDKVLIVKTSRMFRDMPVFYVPELKKCIYGYESYWKFQKDEDLKGVTDEDLKDYSEIVQSFLEKVHQDIKTEEKENG